MLRKVILIAMLASIAVTAASCCSAPSAGMENTSSASESSAANEPEAVKTAVGESTTEKATEKVTEKATEKATEKPTEKVKTEEEKAIEEKGLKVDSKGNVVDKNGNKVKVDENGNVEVKTSDGQTVKVSTQEIKNTTSSNSNSNTTSNKNTAGNSSSKNTSSKPSTSNNNNNNSSSSTPSKPVEKPTTPKATEPPTSKPTEPQKTWHEAVYEYIEHPAEPAVTEQVWVEDQAAYTYEEPVYEWKYRTICNSCGADITENAREHIKQHLLNGTGGGSFHNEKIQIQTGVKTVTVPAQGHYETKVIKEAKPAWKEKVLVKEAGYY